MADEVKTPTRSNVISMLKKGLGFPDLTTNQLKTKVASLSQAAVKGAIRKSGLGGAALMAALDVAMKFAPPQGEAKGVDPLNLFGPKKKKNRVDKKAVEAAVKEAIDSDTAPETSVRPKTRDKPLRPKTRPRENMMYGGMAKAKPRTGNTDYRMGGMFMKNGKK